MRHVLLATTLLVSSLPAIDAVAQSRFSDAFFFGDSLSDDGNIPGLTGGANFPPAPYSANRFSNGPTFAEQLPALIDVPLNPDNNVAVGGALTGTTNGNSALLMIPLPGLQTQIETFTTGGRRFGSNDIVSVFAGANDYFALSTTLAGDMAARAAASNAAVDTAVNNLETAIRDLAEAGARNFIVPLQPLLGSTPGSSLTTANTGLTTDIGLVYNAALRTRLDALSQELGISITPVDTAALLTQVVLNPSQFGITNTTTPCITDAGCVTASVEEQNTFLFFDAVHPTTGVHGFLAAAIAGLLDGPIVGAAVPELGQAGSGLFLDDLGLRLADRRSGRGGFAFLGNLLADASGQSVAQHGAPAARADHPVSVFVSGRYAFGERDERTDRAGFDYDRTQLTLGADVRVAEGVIIGGAFGYALGSAEFERDRGEVDLASTQFGAYAAVFGKRWYVQAGGAYSIDSYDEFERDTGFAGETVSAEIDGRTISATVEAGYLLPLGDRFEVGPFVGYRYLDTQVDEYAEGGAPGLTLSFDEQTLRTHIFTAGAVASTRFSLGAMQVQPSLRVAAEYETGDDRTVTSRVVGGGGTVDTPISEDGDLSVRIALGIAAAVSQTLEVGAEAETRVGHEDGMDSSVTLRARISF